jgi:hypothetical protein
MVVDVKTTPTAYEAQRQAITTLRAALAEPVQEPVLVVEKEPDYWSRGHFHQGTKPHIDPTKVWNLPIGTKLYSAPPQRKPLTEEEVEQCFRAAGITIKGSRWTNAVRNVERAHGIGEQP